MSTQLFLRQNSIAPIVVASGDVVPGVNGIQTTPIASSTQALSVSRGVQSTNVGFGINSASGPTTIDLNNYWISSPIDADTTISGAITFNIWGHESSMSANAGLQAKVYRVDSFGAIQDLIVAAAKGSELGTSGSAQNWTATPSTGVLVHKGERLLLLVEFVDAGGTMGSGFTLSIEVDHNASGADGDSWVQFTETFSTLGSAAGSQLFLTDNASAVKPFGSFNANEAWTSRGSGSTTASAASANGPVSPIQLNTLAGKPAYWFSRPLQAFTLSGIIRVNVRGLESSSAANARLIGEIAVCDNDGSNPVVWASGPLGVSELGTSDAVNSADLAGEDVSVANGQRLRVIVYVDDARDLTMATGFTITMSYSGTTSGADGDSFVTLTQTVSEYIVTGGTVIDPMGAMGFYGQ